MSAPLETMTFPGAPGGSNLAIPQSELDDNEAYIVQDAFVHLPAYTRRRGPVIAESGAPDIAYTPWGIVTVLDPGGTAHIGVLHGYNSGNATFSILNQARTAWAVEILLAITPTSFPPIVATSPGPEGTMIGWSGGYATQTAGNQGIIYWGGGDKANYSNTTTSITREQTAMTSSGGGYTANVAAGMWAFSGNQLIGQVRSVNSNTSITLVKGSTKTVAAGTVAFKSIRGPLDIPHVMTGEFTTTNGNTTVNGGDTKFNKQMNADSTWDLFRWWDFNYEGTVSAIASDIQLTLVSGANHSNVSDEFVGIRSTALANIVTDANTTYGWIPASYAKRQFYANLGTKRELTYRLWYSDEQNAEALDTTTDGDWLEIKSSEGDHKPIRGLATAHNSLLIFKEDETFALYGTSPDTFTLQRVHDDGLWSPMTIQYYNEGVIWAGKRGVYFYDGSTITNLIESKLGQSWRQGLIGQNPDSAHMWSMLDNHHYFLHFSWASPVVLTRAAVTETPNVWTMAMNLDTGAITFLTNLRFRGAASLPVTIGNKAFYVIPTTATTVGKICDSSDLFYTTGVDTLTCYQATIGPAFYFESKKFAMEDPLRLKRFKQLTLHYLSNAGAMKIDTSLGLNVTGTNLTTQLLDSVGLWKVKRLRFTKKSQYFSFRLYQADATLTQFNLGPYQLEYKQLRPGRV